MQYYTRQQLQGSLRYANSVLVGNWNEDRSVKETVLKDFLHKADSATLKIDQCGFSACCRSALCKLVPALQLQKHAISRKCCCLRDAAPYARAQLRARVDAHYRFQANMAQALAPAELTVVRDDGHVHFGDVVQLAHAGPSQAVLATDIHDAVRCLLSPACLLFTLATRL